MRSLFFPRMWQLLDVWKNSVCFQLKTFFIFLCLLMIQFVRKASFFRFLRNTSSRGFWLHPPKKLINQRLGCTSSTTENLLWGKKWKAWLHILLANLPFELSALLLLPGSRCLSFWEVSSFWWLICIWLLHRKPSVPVAYLLIVPNLDKVVKDCFRLLVFLPVLQSEKNQLLRLGFFADVLQASLSLYLQCSI